MATIRRSIAPSALAALTLARVAVFYLASLPLPLAAQPGSVLQQPADKTSAPVEADQKTAAQTPATSVEQTDASRETDFNSNRLPQLLSPHNVGVWLISHGIAIVVILAVLAVTLWAAQWLQGRLIALLTLRGGRGSADERQARSKTLVGVLHNASRTVIVIAAVIMILEELSVPVGPILGGAAVVGLAVAFGAQSLIKDYFTGFMVLIEQQYVIGDVVQIGDIKGQVERITLRLTMLRDLEGRAHFIPHGQINTVTNMTHEWSRAVFDIGVAYKEDVNRVMEVLQELGQSLRADPRFESIVLDNPVMLGVDAFGDSAVTVKFTIMTRPQRQWEVKREMLRRIKLRFDELGIESHSLIERFILPVAYPTRWPRARPAKTSARTRPGGIIAVVLGFLAGAGAVVGVRAQRRVDRAAQQSGCAIRFHAVSGNCDWQFTPVLPASLMVH
jgi:small conductance mechanosensitive channel